jgi:hypothetical protein
MKEEIFWVRMATERGQKNELKCERAATADSSMSAANKYKQEYACVLQIKEEKMLCLLAWQHHASFSS